MLLASTKLWDRKIPQQDIVQNMSKNQFQCQTLRKRREVLNQGFADEWRKGPAEYLTPNPPVTRTFLSAAADPSAKFSWKHSFSVTFSRPVLHFLEWPQQQGFSIQTKQGQVEMQPKPNSSAKFLQNTPYWWHFPVQLCIPILLECPQQGCLWTWVLHSVMW